MSADLSLYRSDFQFAELFKKLGAGHPLFTMLPWDNNFCIYCGHGFSHIKSASTREHLLPKSRNGNNSPFNKRAACKACNGEKGNLTPAEHIQLLEHKLEIATKRNDRKKVEDISIKLENAQAVLEYVNFAHDLLKQPIARMELSLTVYSEEGKPMGIRIKHDVKNFAYLATFDNGKTVASGASIPAAIENLFTLQ